MKFIKHKLLPGILVMALFLTMIPATALATSQNDETIVYDEAGLRNAIAAIPEGGSGEITLENNYIWMSDSIYFENKDIVFNLKNSQLTTATLSREAVPVILALDSDVTINADDNSSMTSEGTPNGMGVVRVDNGSYDSESGTYKETCKLTVNGGRYICGAGEYAYSFAVPAGTTAILNHVFCDSPVESVLGVGLDFGGDITIQSGRFVNDIEDYVAEGKFFWNVGQKYYVRDKEFSDDFSNMLTDGKIVFDYVKPSEGEDVLWLIAEDLWVEYPYSYLDPESFSDDLMQCEIVIHSNTAREEAHKVDIVWNYDSEILNKAKPIIEQFSDKDEDFEVTDLELINYWVYSNLTEDGVDTMANYSSELKTYLNNSNFLLPIENRAGMDETFFDTRIGSAKLMHDGIVYYVSGRLGARAEHVIYVPTSTADTREALAQAAQKRVDDYIGKGVVKITPDTRTLTEYYDNEIAKFDNELAEAQRKLTAARETLANEMQKEEALRDANIVTQCQMDIFLYEFQVETIPQNKQWFMDMFAEGGEFDFLKKAAGDFFFKLEVNGKEYQLVTIKDDTKLKTPTYKTVDLNTKVEVKTESSSIPLDTAIEVEKLTKGERYDKIIDILDVEENETFDIKLHSGSLNEYVTKLKDGTFEVRIPIPKKFGGKNLVVYYVDKDDKPIAYEVTVKDNYAVFRTDHFSVYTLTEASESGSAGNNSVPKTGDNLKMELWLSFLMVSSWLIVSHIERRRKVQMK